MMIFNLPEIDLQAMLTDGFEEYGLYPRCRNCRERCRQPNAPGLVRLVCPMSPEWEAENERLNNGGFG